MGPVLCALFPLQRTVIPPWPFFIWIQCVLFARSKRESREARRTHLAVLRWLLLQTPITNLHQVSLFEAGHIVWQRQTSFLWLIVIVCMKTPPCRYFPDHWCRGFARLPLAHMLGNRCPASPTSTLIWPFLYVTKILYLPGLPRLSQLYSEVPVNKHSD